MHFELELYFFYAILRRNLLSQVQRPTHSLESFARRLNRAEIRHQTHRRRSRDRSWHWKPYKKAFRSCQEGHRGC